MDRFSERRLVENELLFRAANRKVQKQVQKDHNRYDGLDGADLQFYCECSNLRCRDRIRLTSDEYDAATQGRKEFVVLSGHQNPAVEKVLRETAKYIVVEKYLDPAKITKDLV